MKVFTVTAREFYGMAVIVAETKERALEIARENMDRSRGKPYICEEIDTSGEVYIEVYSE